MMAQINTLVSAAEASQGSSPICLEVSGETIARTDDASISVEEIKAYFDVNVRERDRLTLLKDERRFSELVRQLLETRGIANEALQAGILENQDFMAEMYQAAVNFLRRGRMEQVWQENKLEEYEQQARELYLARPELFRPPSRYSFKYLFASAEIGQPFPEALLDILVELRSGDAEFGDVAAGASSGRFPGVEYGEFNGKQESEIASNLAGFLSILEDGELSEPIRAPKGWYILLRESEIKPDIPEFSAVRSAAVARAMKTHRNEIEARYFASLDPPRLEIDQQVLDALIEHYEN